MPCRSVTSGHSPTGGVVLDAVGHGVAPPAFGAQSSPHAAANSAVMRQRRTVVRSA